MDAKTSGMRLLLFAAVIFTAPLSTAAADTGQIDAASLKQMLSAMGYTLKDLNEQKFEFTLQSSELEIPIGAEVSASKNFIWLTVNLGQNRTSLNHEALLKQNTITQPSFFYITRKNNLMMGVAMENRGLNPAVVRRIVEKLMHDVQDTRPVWDVP